MKILHLLYESCGDYFGIGGVGIRAYEIYRHLRERHDITLLCKRYPGARDGQIEGLAHIFVGAESERLTRALISYAYRASLFVRRYGEAFDVIVEEFSPAIPTFLHLWTEKPLILQIQGYTGLLYFRKYNPLYASILCGFEQVRPRFYRHIIFVSEWTLKKYTLSQNAHVSVITNGISEDLLRVSSDEDDYILFLGRIDIYGKGLDILLAAYQEFVRSFPHIKIKVAGDGRDMVRFKNLISTLPNCVKKNVDLLGWISGRAKTECLRKAMFVVFPSRHEVQPIAVLEAMACGKPIIVSDIPEFSFVTRNGAGSAFKSGNHASLVRSMMEMAESRIRREIGQKARESVKDRTWNKIAVLYEKFLEQVAGHGLIDNADLCSSSKSAVLQKSE